MVVEPHERLSFGPGVWHGLGVVVGCAIPLATVVCYEGGVQKELRRQTALQFDTRCNVGVAGRGPWERDCRLAANSVDAARVAAWIGRGRAPASSAR